MKVKLILNIGLLLFMTTMMFVKQDWFNPFRLLIVALVWVATYVMLTSKKTA